MKCDELRDLKGIGLKLEKNAIRLRMARVMII